jgi:hypothetical protein
VLKPVSENLHQIMGTMQRTLTNLEILQKEQRRLRSFTSAEGELPLLPGKQLIQLEYDLMKARQEVEVARHQLAYHGLSQGQIEQVGKGEIPPVDAGIWLGALEHNGLWPPLAAADLRDWQKETPAAGRHFLALGGLLQRGHSLAEVQSLHRLGALEPVVKVLAPAGAPDWDVQDIMVKPGRMVAAGDPLLMLENPRSLFLRGEPAPGEIELCRTALTRGDRVDAEPMVAGAGPALRNLQPRRLYTLADPDRTALLVPLTNSVLTTREGPGGVSYRTWQVSQGLRYQLHIPRIEYKDVYVFPTNTVVEDGPGKVLFLKSGSGFRRIEVPVLHQDHRVVVLPSSADIFPGNPVVTRGAFALKLAYDQAGGGSHAGHNH